MCTMSQVQQQMYDEVEDNFKQCRIHGEKSNGAARLMQLRKAANHPLLHRRHYTDKQLKRMAELLFTQVFFLIRIKTLYRIELMLN